MDSSQTQQPSAAAKEFDFDDCLRLDAVGLQLVSTTLPPPQETPEGTLPDRLLPKRQLHLPSEVWDAVCRLPNAKRLKHTSIAGLFNIGRSNRGLSAFDHAVGTASCAYATLQVLRIRYPELVGRREILCTVMAALMHGLGFESLQMPIESYTGITKPNSCTEWLAKYTTETLEKHLSTALVNLSHEDLRFVAELLLPPQDTNTPAFLRQIVHDPQLRLSACQHDALLRYSYHFNGNTRYLECLRQFEEIDKSMRIVNKQLCFHDSGLPNIERAYGLRYLFMRSIFEIPRNANINKTYGELQDTLNVKVNLGTADDRHLLDLQTQALNGKPAARHAWTRFISSLRDVRIAGVSHIFLQREMLKIPTPDGVFARIPY